jgi:putative FmdB family regulatory protein
MPTYHYRCNACRREFEKVQPITAPALKKCPKCAKWKLCRLISGGGAILFKGSGFYCTDYRSKDYREQAKQESSAASSDAGRTESKPESKPEGKSESKRLKKKPAAGHTTEGGKSV